MSSKRRHGNQSLAEVVWWAIRQYRRHLELVYPFLGFGLVALVLEFRFELLWTLFDIDPALGVTADPTPIRDWLSDPVAETLTPLLEDLFILLLIGVVSLFVFTLVMFLFTAGIAFLVASDEYTDTTRSQVSRTFVVIRRLPALVAASLLGSILIAAGTVLFVLPGLYLATRFALGGPAIIIDGHGPLSGLRESWLRTKGQLLEVGSIALGGAISVSVVGFVPLVGEAVGTLVVLPILLITLGRLYYEQGPHKRSGQSNKTPR